MLDKTFQNLENLEIIKSADTVQYLISLVFSLLIAFGYSIFTNLDLYTSIMSNTGSSLNDVTNLFIYSLPFIGNNAVIIDILILIVSILTFLNCVLLLIYDESVDIDINEKSDIGIVLFFTFSILVVFMVSYYQYMIIVSLVTLSASMYMIIKSI